MDKDASLVKDECSTCHSRVLDGRKPGQNRTENGRFSFVERRTSELAGVACFICTCPFGKPAGEIMPFADIDEEMIS
jgi:hypothetical protein